LDATVLASGAQIFSLPSEAQAIPRVGFTQAAWEQTTTYFGQILRDRCAMRAELQVANGGKATPDGVCTPQGAK
jgi:hypothetical protein